MTRTTGNLSSSERAWSAIAGAALSLLALRRGSPVLRSLAALAGASLVARSAAGHCAMKAALNGETSLGEGLRDQWSRLSMKGLRKTEGLPGSAAHASRSRAVDESIDQSFPSSDPPASRLPDEPPINAEAKWEAARNAAVGEPGV